MSEMPEDDQIVEDLLDLKKFLLHHDGWRRKDIRTIDTAIERIQQGIIRSHTVLYSHTATEREE